MKEINLKEVQSIELKILKKLDQYCKENDISYYLGYGTLLGAVRHKGFIPWDDDVDVFMTREDYNKLIELEKIKKIGKDYELICPENNKWHEPIIKIIDKNTKSDKNKKNSIGLWVDVFPLDYYDEKVCKKNQVLRNIIIAKGTTKIINPRKDIIKLIVKLLFLPISSQKITNKIIKNSKSVSKNDIYGNTSFTPYKNDIIKKEELQSAKIIFDGYMFNAIKNYDGYLKNRYGDYMKLPPKNKRRTHGINALFLGDDLEEYLNNNGITQEVIK